MTKARTHKEHHVSASQMGTWSPTYEGCNRKWAFQKIDGLPDPAGAGAILGGKVHEALEAFVLRGQVLPAGKVGQVARRALPWAKELLAHPEWNVEVERAFWHREDGVLYMGKVDIGYMLPNAPVVQDWKTSSNPEEYGLRPETMLDDPQAVLYARQEFGRRPEAQTLILRWVYMHTRAAVDAFDVEREVSRAEVDAAWPRVHAVGREITAARTRAAHEPSISANDFEPNYDACGNYNKPCPFLEHCEGAYDPKRIISGIFDAPPIDAPAFHPKSLLQPQKQTQTQEPPQIMDMSPEALLANRRRRQRRAAPLRPEELQAQQDAAQAAEPEPEPEPEAAAAPPVTPPKRGPGRPRKPAVPPKTAEPAEAPAARPGLDPARVKWGSELAAERAGRINAPESGMDDPDTQAEISKENAQVIEQNPGRGKGKDARETFAETAADAIAQGDSVSEATAKAREAAGLEETGERSKPAKKTTRAKKAGDPSPAEAWLRLACSGLAADELDALYKQYLALFG